MLTPYLTFSLIIMLIAMFHSLISTKITGRDDNDSASQLGLIVTTIVIVLTGIGYGIQWWLVFIR